MSGALGKLRGAVVKVMTDGEVDTSSGAQPLLDVPPKRVNIWTEIARGMRKASEEEETAAAATEAARMMRSSQQLSAVSQSSLFVPGGVNRASTERRGSHARIKSLVQHLDTVLNKPTPGTDQDGGGRVEEFLQLQHLQQVKAQFESYQPQQPLDSAGRKDLKKRNRYRQSGRLNMQEFKEVLSHVIGHERFAEQLERLFQKLDTESQGYVSWTEFCNYMMLYLNESDRLSIRVEPPFKSDPKLRHVMYNRQEPTARLLLTESPTRPISVSKTGCILLWDCSLKLEAHLETQGPHGDLANAGKRLFNEWIMDAVFMENCHKLVLSTTGREIKFYDIASNVIKEEFVLYGLRSVPNVLKFHYKKEAANTDCELFLGDDEGSLTVLVFKRPMQQLFDVAPEPNHRSQRIWYHELAAAHAKCVEAQQHDNLHTEGINDLVYLADTGCTVSCSTSPVNSVVIYNLANRRAVYTFRLRRGAECFDIARGLNLIVTGSADHLVRFWNPYVPGKPTALLEGHSNSVLSVRIHERHGYALSYARDGVIKVWDVRTQRCVQSVVVHIPYGMSEKLPEHMNNPLTLHAHSSTVYLTSTDNILQYRLGKASDPVPGLIQTHKAQLCSAIYNPLFRQVTTASDDSCVATWDLESGSKCLVFANAHGDEEITCLIYDQSWRRLMTGSRHGAMKIWNFQSGQVLHELEKTSDAEITGMWVVPLQQSIVTVGWSRQIVCYKDTNPENHLRRALNWRGGAMHEDDILTSDFCGPDLLATGSYDGALMVWNVELEKLLVKLREGYQERIEKKIYRAQGLTPPPSRCSTATGRPTGVVGSSGSVGGNSRPNSRHRRSHQIAPERSPAPVDKLLFLRQRASDKRQRESGFLVTSDAGIVRFWSVHGLRHELAAFRAAAGPDECVLAMATNKRNSALLTGDTCGFVRSWSITNYAMFQRDTLETQAPPCLTDFRAHDAAIVSVDFAEVERGDFIITASVDCTARLFASNGDVIGTFGQPKPWDIGNRKTWKQAQIDRQKFFEEVEAMADKSSNPSESRTTFAAPQIVTPDADEPNPSSTPEPISPKTAVMKTRSLTMPVASVALEPTPTESSSSEQVTEYKPLIGLKAEQDFERIRLSRSGRRNEFGGVAALAPMPTGAVCTPYAALKTTEFKSFSMSANLPQPSWASVGRSRTAVSLSRSLPAAATAASPTSGASREFRLLSRPNRSLTAVGISHEGSNRVRLPPIADEA